MSDLINQFTDPYERKSRLEPMRWALLPFFFLLVIYTPVPINLSLKSAGAVLVYGMVASLLSRIARNAGKGKEEALKASWGGWPSMMLFRHSDPKIDVHTKANIHKAMAKAVPGTAAPTPEEEKADPARCDQIYTAWSEHLRKLARKDQKKFPHVFKANMSYGFWRNLYGMKGAAICLLLLAIAVAVIHALYAWNETSSASPWDLAMVIGAFIAILLWCFGVTRKAVRIAADSYADRLLDDCVPESKSRAKKNP